MEKVFNYEDLPPISIITPTVKKAMIRPFLMSRLSNTSIIQQYHYFLPALKAWESTGNNRR